MKSPCFRASLAALAPPAFAFLMDSASHNAQLPSSAAVSSSSSQLPTAVNKAVPMAVPMPPSVAAATLAPATLAPTHPVLVQPPAQSIHHHQQPLQPQPLLATEQYAHVWTSESHSQLKSSQTPDQEQQQGHQQPQQQSQLTGQTSHPHSQPTQLPPPAPPPPPPHAAIHPLHHPAHPLSTQHHPHYFHHPVHPVHAPHATHVIHAAPDHHHAHSLASQHPVHQPLTQHITYTTHPHAHVPVAMSVAHTSATTSAPAISASDHQVITQLEVELAAARREIEALRSKIAELEKDRTKAENIKTQSRYWTPDEHKRFIEALHKYGPKDVRAIANFVGSRNATQVRTHAQKYFLRIARESRTSPSSLQASRKRSMSESDLARVGHSATTPPGSPVPVHTVQVANPSNHTALSSFPSAAPPHFVAGSETAAVLQTLTMPSVMKSDSDTRLHDSVCAASPPVNTIPGIVNRTDTCPGTSNHDDEDAYMSVSESSPGRAEHAYGVKAGEGLPNASKTSPTNSLSSFPRSTTVSNPLVGDYTRAPSSSAKPPPPRGSYVSSPAASIAEKMSSNQLPRMEVVGDSDIVHMQIERGDRKLSSHGSGSPEKNAFYNSNSGSPSPARVTGTRPPAIVSSRTPPRPAPSTLPDSSGINLLSIVASERKLAADKQSSLQSTALQSAQPQTGPAQSVPRGNDQADGRTGTQ